MKVTGYKLKEAIKIKQIELSAIESQFNDTLFVFAGEEGKSLKPEEAAKRISELKKTFLCFKQHKVIIICRYKSPTGNHKFIWKMPLNF